MINTKFAQTFVSSTKALKLSVLSVVFTFVFLGMGVTTQAQSFTTSPGAVDASVLDQYSFKVDRGQVISTLNEFRTNFDASGQTEVYAGLCKALVGDITSTLNDYPLMDVQQVMRRSFYNLNGFAARYGVNAPSALVNQVFSDVSDLIQ
jgi:hypothetical protein